MTDPQLITGWLTREEGRVLQALAYCADGLVVEIGSYLGRSTAYLAQIGPVYAIDHHHGSVEHGTVDTLDRFRRNMDTMGVAGNVRILCMSSAEAAQIFRPQSIGLLFLDGSHDYEDVDADWNNYLPLIREGGILAMHDTVGWAGPQRVSKRFFEGDWHRIDWVHSITWAARQTGAPARPDLWSAKEHFNQTASKTN